MSDLSGSQVEEPAPHAGSSNAAEQTGAAAPAIVSESAPAPAPRFSQDAATGWATLVFVIAQAIGTTVILMSNTGGAPTSAAPMYYDGTLVALVTLITNPALVGLFWWVARRQGFDAREFLGLTRFRVSDFVIGFLAIAGLAAVLYLVAHFAKLDVVPRFQTETYVSARRDGWLLPLLAAVVLVGPIGEEIMFRGFLYCGWVRPGFVVTPIIMIAATWAGMHLQYGWFGMSQVFLIGLLLGWLRWRSGSTFLTIVLHILVNLEASIETFFEVGWTAT